MSAPANWFHDLPATTTPRRATPPRIEWMRPTPTREEAPRRQAPRRRGVGAAGALGIYAGSVALTTFYLVPVLAWVAERVA